VTLHAVNKNVRVRLVCKVPLDRFVGAAGVTDKDLKVLLDYRVETAFYLGGEPGNPP
jgi:hypothetical protein